MCPVDTTQSVTRTSYRLSYSDGSERREFVDCLSSSPFHVPSDADAPRELRRYLPYLSRTRPGLFPPACGGGIPRTATRSLLRGSRSPVQPAVRFCLRRADALVGRTQRGSDSVRQHTIHPAVQGELLTSCHSCASYLYYCLFELSNDRIFFDDRIQMLRFFVW